MLKGVKLALCGMECVNLNNNVTKILEICYSYDKKRQNFLKMWRMKNLLLLGNISIFKTLAFSKIIHLTLVTSVPSTVDLLCKIQIDVLLDKKNAKIKRATLCCDYADSGLKSIDIFSKIVRLQ